jgi:hypothetical protein
MFCGKNQKLFPYSGSSGWKALGIVPPAIKRGDKAHASTTSLAGALVLKSKRGKSSAAVMERSAVVRKSSDATTGR